MSTPQSLAGALRRHSLQSAAADPAVRGGDWRLATVDTVNSDGTIVTTDTIVARRLETYVGAAPGDLIRIDESSAGSWTAGPRLSSGGVAIGETVAARKTSSTTRASTTTLAADPHLTVTVSPGTYCLDAFLMYDADPAADLKLLWSAPAGTTGGWWPGGADSSMNALAFSPRWGALSDITTTFIPVGATLSGTIVACRPVGTVVIATAGTFALMWAQNASSATATNLRGQSTLRLQRIA